MKVLYFDCETTGLNPEKNDIVQLSALMEVDGKVVQKVDLKCQPWSYDNVDPAAIEVHGMSVDTIRTFDTPRVALNKWQHFLRANIDRYDTADKAYPAGYNVGFDLDFVTVWMAKGGDSYFGAYQNWRALDPLPLLRFLDYLELLPPLPNLRLETVCGAMGIEISAHDAGSDVAATRELLRHLAAFYYSHHAPGAPAPIEREGGGLFGAPAKATGAQRSGCVQERSLYGL